MDLLILCCNSDLTIERVLLSWIDCVNTIYVYLNNSNDRTLEILQKYGCKIFVGPFLGFSNTRNKLIELSTSKRFIFIDDTYLLLERDLFARESIQEFKVGSIRVFSGPYTQVRHIINTCYRYKGHIHEILEKYDTGSITHFKSKILDLQDYFNRTIQRIPYTLKMLSLEPDNERTKQLVKNTKILLTLKMKLPK